MYNLLWICWLLLRLNIQQMSNVTEFYDQFADRQQTVGINHRHLRIQRWLEKFGLQRDDKVLEVGCGIGTVTELILRYLSSKGSLYGVDISPKNIELSKQRLNKYANARLEVIDLTEHVLDEQFDVITLPDVIEHIPLELHKTLFLNLSKMLKEKGFIFVHIPDPNYLQWAVDKGIDGLQIIDQPIHSNLLTGNLQGTGLYIDFLTSYSVFLKGSDYQAIVLKHISSADSYDSILPMHDSIGRRLKNKLRYVLRGNK